MSLVTFKIIWNSNNDQIQKIIDKNWSQMTIVAFLCRIYIYIYIYIYNLWF